jgi:hypothetical protein
MGSQDSNLDIYYDYCMTMQILRDNYYAQCVISPKTVHFKVAIVTGVTGVTGVTTVTTVPTVTTVTKVTTVTTVTTDSRVTSRNSPNSMHKNITTETKSGN